MKLFEQSPDVEIVIGTTQMVRPADASGKTVIPVLPAPLIQHHLGSITCRSRLFKRIGLFDPALRIGEDQKWFRRMLAAGVPIRTTRMIALEYRMRKGSLTYGTINHGKCFIDALRADLVRRRSKTWPRELSNHLQTG
jgi:hypothetical protein